MNYYSDLYLISLIENLRNKKTGEKLSKNTYIKYVSMFYNLGALEELNIVNYLIQHQNNKVLINNKFNFIKSQLWLVNNRNEIHEGNSFAYFIFLNQLLNLIPNIRSIIHESIFDKIHKHTRETNVKKVEFQDEKVSFGDLKINWMDFIKTVNKLTNDPNVPIRDKILFNLYRVITLRDDFGNIKFTEYDDDTYTKNYFNIQTQVLHIRDYKTKRKFGNQQFVLPEYLNKLIMSEYLNGKKYLITNNFNDKYAEGKLSRYIRFASPLYFGKSINIDDIRHSVITYYNQNKSLSQRRKLSKLMLHSLETANTIYNRESL